MIDEDVLIKMYSRTNCPMDPPVRQMLKSANIPYEYIDIRHDEAANALVRQINRGNESVPTLVFPDGSTLTEPSPGSLYKRLNALGYVVPNAGLWPAYVRGVLTNPLYLFLIVMVIFALLRGFGVL